MRFVECVDYGDAQTIFVSGVASVSLISHTQVQIAHYQSRVMPDGTLENRIVAYHICDLTQWLENEVNFREATETILDGAARLRIIARPSH
jgi:hypothetical protein